METPDRRSSPPDAVSSSAGRGLPGAASGCFELMDSGLQAEACVPLTDRGFRFGQHLFETIAVLDARWLFWKEHLEILHHSAEHCGFSLPPEVLARLDHLPNLLPDFAEGMLRLFWTAGDGGVSAPASPGRLFVLAEPLPIPRTPQMLLIHPESFQAPEEIFPGRKTGNYWMRSAVLLQAAAEGFQERILSNPDGTLRGFCTGNLYLLRDGTWLTPPVESGARPGVVRHWMLQQGLAREQTLQVEDLAARPPLLISNSRLGPCGIRLGAPSPASTEETVVWSRYQARCLNQEVASGGR